MDWHDYLREERKRKIGTNDLMSGRVPGCRLTVQEMRNGQKTDTTDEMIATNKEHIAEIEGILTAAGIPFGD